MEQLWPDRPADAALNNLHQALRVARTALSVTDKAGQRILVLREGVLSLCPNGGLWVDAEAFASAVREASVASRLAGHLAARDLYRGELLPDDRYADWAEAPREAVAQDYLTLLSQLAGCWSARETAKPRSRRSASCSSTTGRRKRAQKSDAPVRPRRSAADGPPPVRAAARRAGARARRSNRPTRAGSSTARSSRAASRPAAPTNAVSAAASTGVTPGSPADLADSSRPLAHRTVGRRRHNLPVQLSSFVGREREMREIERLLVSSRALTLTGPGGAGKTRLAIEAAAVPAQRVRGRCLARGTGGLERAGTCRPGDRRSCSTSVNRRPSRSLELVIRHVDERRPAPASRQLRAPRRGMRVRRSVVAHRVSKSSDPGNQPAVAPDSGRGRVSRALPPRPRPGRRNGPWPSLPRSTPSGCSRSAPRPSFRPSR